MSVPPRDATLEWSIKLEGRLRTKLANLGLCDPIKCVVTQGAKEDLTKLGSYWTAYIKGRVDISAATKVKYAQTRRLLIEYFGEVKPLKTIRPIDAVKWKRYLLARPVKQDADGKVLKTMAVATVSKHVKRSRTVFKEAVAEGLISANPFADVKGGGETNTDRQFFVTRALSDQIMDACPSYDWKLVFALPRYGGLRCPSEVMSLRWQDLLWDNNKMRIDSPKTGLRFCPIFPELAPLLTAAYEQAEEGSVFVVSERIGRSNPRTSLTRFIVQSGNKPWEKLFVNLRSTRRTELEDQYPNHVVNAWLGHSTETAMKHYLQVTEEHFRRAAEMPAAITPPKRNLMREP